MEERHFTGWHVMDQLNKLRLRYLTRASTSPFGITKDTRHRMFRLISVSGQPEQPFKRTATKKQDGSRCDTPTDAFAAIQNEDLYALTAALDAGTDPNATDGGGWTLLMEAVILNQVHMVGVLLSCGTHVHLTTSSANTALHFAARCRSDDVFHMIFYAAGPRGMNFPNCYGSTPLHLLAGFGSAEQMAFALSHPGIDVSILNHEGHTPLDVSINYRSALQTYSDQEARWQPLRYTWIKLLILPTR
jgi:ankyrin repeat protein